MRVHTRWSYERGERRHCDNSKVNIAYLKKFRCISKGDYIVLPDIDPQLLTLNSSCPMGMPLSSTSILPGCMAMAPLQQVRIHNFTIHYRLQKTRNHDFLFAVRRCPVDVCYFRANSSFWFRGRSNLKLLPWCYQMVRSLFTRAW